MVSEVRKMPGEVRRTEVRALWRCERCNAYHVGGIDVDYAETEPGGADVRAVCGAEWYGDRPAEDLTEVGTAEVPGWDDVADGARGSMATTRGDIP